jgi:hypothetical protein
MMADLKYAFRMLVKAPAFASIAILTLALGIGANTAIFSLIHDLFLRGLPFKDPSRIVRIYGEAKERDLKQMPFSVPKFWHYRDGQTVFSSIAADWGNGYILTGLGEPFIRFSAAIFFNRKKCGMMSAWLRRTSGANDLAPILV